MLIKLLGFIIVMLTMGGIPHWGLTLKALEHLAIGIGLYWLGHNLR
jgi:hypothetical protein